MEKDRFYPEYHFRPEKNWMNDPNGLIYHGGKYHMFFQHNPNADVWGDIHWGHAESEDLIHWKTLPIALAPSYAEGEIHCYSGCAVPDGEDVRIFYTSIGAGERGPENGAEQWSAKNLDSDLIAWTKSGMPKLRQEINRPDVILMWRDPFIWREDDGWYMLLSGTRNGCGCIAVYKSQDLTAWKYLGIFFETEKYELIECPNMMKFGERYVLLYSPLKAVRYVVGTIDRKSFQFIPETEGVFDYSVDKKGFYAPNVFFNDPKGRKLVFGCLFEGDRLNSSMKRGWAGMQSVPREVRLEETLKIAPAEECLMLRKEVLAKYRRGCSLSETSAVKLSAACAACEIVIRFHEAPGTKLAVELFADAEAEEKTVLKVDTSERKLILDRSRSALRSDVTKENIEVKLRSPAGGRKILPSAEEVKEEKEIRIFADHSSIEIFYNEEAVISARVFPLHASAICHRVLCGDDSIVEGKIWRLGL